MDALDQRLLAILSRDARPNSVQLAKRLGVPRSTVALRIKKLEQRGLIRGYRAHLDHAALGLGQTAFFLIQTPQTPDPEPSLRRVSKLPGVVEAHVISGAWDLLVKVRVRDLPSLWTLQKEILKDKNIGRTETSLCFVSVEDEASPALEPEPGPASVRERSRRGRP